MMIPTKANAIATGPPHVATSVRADTAPATTALLSDTVADNHRAGARNLRLTPEATTQPATIDSSWIAADNITIVSAAINSGSSSFDKEIAVSTRLAIANVTLCSWSADSKDLKSQILRRKKYPMTVPINSDILRPNILDRRENSANSPRYIEFSSSAIARVCLAVRVKYLAKEPDILMRPMCDQ